MKKSKNTEKENKLEKLNFYKLQINFITIN